MIFLRKYNKEQNKPTISLFMIYYGYFSNGCGIYKRSATPMGSESFNTTTESFQIRCGMQVYLKGHLNCQNLKI